MSTNGNYFYLYLAIFSVLTICGNFDHQILLYAIEVKISSVFRGRYLRM